MTLNLLAFLLHAILDVTNSTYAAIRQEPGTRQTFFDDIHALTRFGRDILRLWNWEIYRRVC